MAVYDRAPASLTVECLTDTEVVAFDAEKLDSLTGGFRNSSRTSEKPWNGTSLD